MVLLTETPAVFLPPQTLNPKAEPSTLMASITL